MSDSGERYSGKVTPVGNSKGIRLDAAFFKAHPEFVGEVRATVLANGEVLLSARRVRTFYRRLRRHLPGPPPRQCAAQSCWMLPPPRALWAHPSGKRGVESLVTLMKLMAARRAPRQVILPRC